MSNFFKELKRREVFKTGGLYIGIAWVLIEASSVILPTFDVPEWVFKTIVIIAFIGFPVALVLAWFYDVTEEGVQREDETEGPAGTIVSSRLTNFIIIGILAVALSMSLYFNLTGRPGEVVQHEPVTVLIADFDNQTGDPLFDNALEQALNIGLEGASFITAYPRASAHQLLDKINPGSVLNEEGARLVSIREGIKLIVAGTIKPDGGGYELSVRAVEPQQGEPLTETSVSAKGKLEVLAAVSTLADEVRKELGDTAVNAEDRDPGETFTAASLQAVKSYTVAQELASSFKFDESLEHYRAAVAEDPNFGRAYSGLALALFNLGREDEAGKMWEQALTKMNTMTERERYRTLGLYYLAVTQDFQKGIESYQSLVEKYPADNMGYNNLAVAYFLTLDFASALDAATKGLEIYPNNKLVMSNRALLAMYAGNFSDGATYARQLLELDSAAVLAWLPIAMAGMAENKVDDAKSAYANMAKVSELGDSIASLGLADIAIYLGDASGAIGVLEAGIKKDEAAGLTGQMATKYIALAEAQALQGDTAAVRAAISKALESGGGEARLVPAALLSLEIGDTAAAQSIADKLGQELQPMTRAYAQLIRGVIATQEKRYADALDAFRAGTSLADLWLLRFYQGRAYLEAGKFVEAMDEFQICHERRGEAASIFLDEKPTWRYLATLPYWMGRAQEMMGMTDVAKENFIAYVATRPEGGPFVDDARERVGK